MRKQIRNNVFETNSSSCHAICISKNTVSKSDLPSHVTFARGEFGWEGTEYCDVWSKASYLYEAILSCYYGHAEEKLNEIKQTLKQYNIECDFEPKNNDWGYIDHGGNTIDFVEAVLEDDDKLLTYLFGDGFIVTGNDNGSEFFHDRMYDEIDNYNYQLKSEFDNYDVYEKWN